MNVIIIISDSMRRDCLGCYGAPPWISLFKTGINQVHTPHLDHFARRSLIFDNAFIASFPTVPSRNDILTGRYTWTYKPWSPLGEDEITLPEVLNEEDVLTGLVVDTPHPFAPGYNYQRDFQTWELIRGQEQDRWKASPSDIQLPAAKHKFRNPDKTVVQYLRNMQFRQGEEDYFPARTFRQAAKWLEENHQRAPFFLYIDTFDPHEPWDPPKYYTDLYDPGYTGEEVIYPKYDYCDYLSEAELNHCRALYAGEVTMVDHWFGYLLDRIESLGLLENSVVFFLSDHGFYLGDHGFMGKVIIRSDFRQSIPLYPEVARIPLLIHVPDAMRKSRGERIVDYVQTVDLMPTICELLGVPQPDSVKASSFAPILNGRPQAQRDFVICAPTISYPELDIPHPTDRASIYSREWLLVYGAQSDLNSIEAPSYMVDSVSRSVRTLEEEPIQPQLYNLQIDPFATQNIIEDNLGIARDLHAKFFNFLQQNHVPEKHLRYFEHL